MIKSHIFPVLWKIKDYFRDSKDEVHFIDEGSISTLGVDCFIKILPVKSNVAWNIIRGRCNWLNVEIVENGVKIVATPNFTGKTRKVTLSIQTLKKEWKRKISSLKIEQKPTIGDFVLVSEGDVWLNYHQTKTKIIIGAKKAWTVNIDADWLSVNKIKSKSGVHTLELQCKANQDKEKREANLLFILGDKKKSQKIIQRGQKTHEDVTHCIYVNIGTFPVLYSAMYMLQNVMPSILIDDRQTLDVNELPDYVQLAKFDEYPSNVLNFIRKIEKDNSDAVYSFCVDDIRGKSAMSLFTRLGIDESRVKISLYPDGTGTYKKAFYENYGKDGIGIKFFKAKQKELRTFYEKRKQNRSIAIADTNRDGIDLNLDFEAPHLMALNKNVKYYIQSKDYLITDDNLVRKIIKENENYIELSPNKILQSLSKDKEMRFLAMTGLDINWYKTRFEESLKPIMVVLGSGVVSGLVTPQRQYNSIKEVMRKYDKDYTIYYKPHPIDRTYLEYEKEFENLNILLPANMPFEVLMWSLQDYIAAIGGFNSTIFLTIPLDKVKFMFAEKIEDLGEIHEKIFKSQKGIYWISGK